MIYCLSVHAAYRCRHSGACCTSGWPIPVESHLRAGLDSALSSGRLLLPGGQASPFIDRPELAEPGDAILRCDPSGNCACYDRDRHRCAIHAQLGHDALPVSCQHFPRVCLIDESGTFVSLSHYCPTAAGMLFRDERPAIVAAPPDFAPMAALEGLDARGALAPLLHPRMLMEREIYRRWERHVVALLGEDVTPDAALGRIIGGTEAFRRWEPRHGPIEQALDAAFAAGTPRAHVAPSLNDTALWFDRLVRASVPPAVAPVRRLEHGHTAAGDLRSQQDFSPAPLWARLVAPAWQAFAAPVRRYLAARAFASWCAYQGRGLRTVVASLVASYSVLRVEAARQCAASGRMLDAALLEEAFRSADLLIVHLTSREDLARRLSALEKGRGEDLAAAL